MGVEHYLADENRAAIVTTKVIDGIEVEKKEMVKIVEINLAGFYRQGELDGFLEMLHKELSVNA